MLVEMLRSFLNHYVIQPASLFVLVAHLVAILIDCYERVELRSSICSLTISPQQAILVDPQIVCLPYVRLHSRQYSFHLNRLT